MLNPAHAPCSMLHASFLLPFALSAFPQNLLYNMFWLINNQFNLLFVVWNILQFRLQEVSQVPEMAERIQSYMAERMMISQFISIKYYL